MLIIYPLTIQSVLTFLSYVEHPFLSFEGTAILPSAMTVLFNIVTVCKSSLPILAAQIFPDNISYSC